MAQFPITCPWDVLITGEQKKFLWEHLFPGDHDEHAAVLHCGITVTEEAVRLTVRRVILAQDGVDFVDSPRAYKRLKAEFITNCILGASDENVCYLAVHNHGGKNSVAFSPVDLQSHERGYPALLDLAGGPPVGALVFAENAVAGDIWLPGGVRIPIRKMTVIGASRSVLFPSPPNYSEAKNEQFDRQARIFGDLGQTELHGAKVAVVGLGGVGSLVTQMLAHLGVGHLVLVDYDRLELSNVSRVVGSRPRLAFPIADLPFWPSKIRNILNKFKRKKIDIAGDLARKVSNPHIEYVFGDVKIKNNAKTLRDCDYIFLCADGHSARLVVNEICHRYFVPIIQIGSKVPVDPDTGEIGEIFCAIRPAIPGTGCLWCNQLINPARLEQESKSSQQIRNQKYVDGVDIPAPSVITLNSIGASHAVNDFLFYLTGLFGDRKPLQYQRALPLERSLVTENPRKSTTCDFCSEAPTSYFGLGDSDGGLATAAKA